MIGRTTRQASDKKEVTHSIGAAFVMLVVFVICAYIIVPLFFRFMDWFGFNFVPVRFGGGSEIGNEGLLQLMFRGALALIASVSAGYFAGSRFFPKQSKKYTFVYAGAIITALLILFLSYPAIIRSADSISQPPLPVPALTQTAIIQQPAQPPISSAQLPPPTATEIPIQPAYSIKPTPEKTKHISQTVAIAASENQCINNCFVFEVYHDEMDPDFKPYRIVRNSVGVYRRTIYVRSASEDNLDYYLDKVPKTVRDLAPMRALRLAKELQNSDRGIYPSPEEQAINRLNDKLNTIKTNQFLMNQKVEETQRRINFGF